MKDDALSGWYLVYTKPRHENIAEINLKRQGFCVYLPLLQQHKRVRNLYQIVTEPLFPRYLFVYLSAEIDDWSKVRSTRGCVSLVRFGSLPARVPDKLLDQLKHDEDTRFNQEQSSTPDFQPGDRVRVIDGMLINYEGIIENKNSQQRVTLLLTITEGHTRSVNLSVHKVKAVN